MTRCHIQTPLLVVSLIALMLAIFITCKKISDRRYVGDENEGENFKDLTDYKNSEPIDFNVDFKEKDSKEVKTDENKQYKDFNILQTKSQIIPFTTLINVARFRAVNPKKKTSIGTTKNDDNNSGNIITRKYCVNMANTLRARHKSCFLRPDTGPCRSDIIQWYYDARLSKCFRFFWGGCQGNGNKFENRRDCMGYCFLNSTMGREKLPYFCKLSFDFGTCFGHYYRWYWDRYSKTCKRRLYSGCGGNQNNFQSYKECFATCVTIPNDTLKYTEDKGTTCITL